MRAVIADRTGPPDVLQPVELPDPEPAAGQVLVAVEAAAITFIDTQMRAGTSPRPLPPDAFPVVLGNGVAGTVAAVGDGVPDSWTGAAVVTTTGGRGGYASRALAAASDLHRIPAGLDGRTAVALVADGRTALGLARAAAIRPGETVAVTAAGGGVGSILVQLAVNAGATVVALAGDARKLDLACGLGAAVAINYRDDDWAEQVAGAAPGGIDVAFDGVGGATSGPLVERMSPGGRYLPHGASSGSWGDVGALAARRGVTVVPLASIGGGPEGLNRLIDEALDLAAAGRIRPTIGQTYPLAEAAAAHAAIEARTALGKTLLIP
jgi:NADPH2:quinone reductase